MTSRRNPSLGGLGLQRFVFGLRRRVTVTGKYIDKTPALVNPRNPPKSVTVRVLRRTCDKRLANAPAFAGLSVASARREGNGCPVPVLTDDGSRRDPGAKARPDGLKGLLDLEDKRAC